MTIVETKFGSIIGRGATLRGVAKPSIFIIDRDGIIRYKYVGKRTDDRPSNKKSLQVLAGIKEKN
jgi:peroxiredoxin